MAVHDEELETYDENVGHWRHQHLDQYALIKGGAVTFCDSYEDALLEGYRAYGLDETFLVKRVDASEPVLEFSR